MAEIENKTLGKNLKRLREFTGLSQHYLASLTEISKRSIANIEGGKRKIDIAIVFKLRAFFFMYTLDQLCDTDIIIEDSLKEKLIEKFKKENPGLMTVLSKQPTIVFAIKNKLLKSDFIDDPKGTKKIREYFIKNYGWKFGGPAIANALKRMPNLIKIDEHSNKGNANVYSKRKTMDGNSKN
jgi:transcriptional regulator with XRE-family HTH domain